MFYTSSSGAPVLHVAADLQLTSHKKFGWRPESYGATHSENCKSPVSNPNWYDRRATDLQLWSVLINSEPIITMHIYKVVTYIIIDVLHYKVVIMNVIYWYEKFNCMNLGFKFPGDRFMFNLIFL